MNLYPSLNTHLLALKCNHLLQGMLFHLSLEHFDDTCTIRRTRNFQGNMQSLIRLLRNYILLVRAIIPPNLFELHNLALHVHMCTIYMSSMLNRRLKYDRNRIILMEPNVVVNRNSKLQTKRMIKMESFFQNQIWSSIEKFLSFFFLFVDF